MKQRSWAHGCFHDSSTPLGLRMQQSAKKKHGHKKRVGSGSKTLGKTKKHVQAKQSSKEDSQRVETPQGNTTRHDTSSPSHKLAAPSDHLAVTRRPRAAGPPQGPRRPQPTQRGHCAAHARGAASRHLSLLKQHAIKWAPPRRHRPSPHSTMDHHARFPTSCAPNGTMK